MSLTQYYTATTLDGFIADPDNSLDWLFTRKREDDGPLNYGEFIAHSVRWRWDLRHTNGSSTTNSQTRIRWAGNGPTTYRAGSLRTGNCLSSPTRRIEFTSADIATVHGKMVAEAGDRNVWIVGGGDLAGQFADVGLLDEIIVSIAPVTLGQGAPLLPRRVELRLDELGRNGDLACARFSVVRPPA